MYDEGLVAPMRAELTEIGFEELRTTDAVETSFAEPRGTLLLVVNSVCGCAAGNARPAIRLALEHATRPDRLATVFAGQDLEATAEARVRFSGFRPSSPQIALFKDGELVHMVERHQIEGRAAPEIAADLTSAFDRYCN